MCSPSLFKTIFKTLGAIFGFSNFPLCTNQYIIFSCDVCYFQGLLEIVGTIEVVIWIKLSYRLLVSVFTL